MNDDHDLRTKVLAELAWEPSINADHIGVTAAGGVVTLSGHVASYWQKLAAERAVSRVRGVRAIAEEIDIHLASDPKRTDEEIADAILHHFAWDVSIPVDAVKVRVESGFVTLTGEVAWHYQHDAVARAVRSLQGLTGMANQVTITLRPDARKLDTDITHALHRSWLSDDHVKVSADGGKVHLTGTVGSWMDRNMAGSMAWSAPGTTSVVNDIAVN